MSSPKSPKEGVILPFGGRDLQIVPSAEDKAKSDGKGNKTEGDRKKRFRS